MFPHRSLHLLAFTSVALHGLASAAPLPQVRGGPAYYVGNANAGRGPHEVHGISFPGDYDMTAAYDSGNDEDLHKFNAAVYGDERGLPQALPANKHTAEEQAIMRGIPSKIASSPAARDFDEDLSVLNTLVKPESELLAASPDLQTNANSPTTSTSEIPASEIATEFPEYPEPRTFSTEKVGYSLRTNNPHSGPDAPGGEENSNVALFSDDKAFHWSGGSGEPLPRNDPQFKEALSWITGKFQPSSGKGKGKGRARKDSVFNILGNF